MRSLKWIARYVYYLFVLLIFLSRSLTGGFGHDENQFIAAGQLLADHGLLPYLNYPYTHMPYGVLFYALTARLTSYDFLAGRIMNAVCWFVSSLLIVYIFKLFWRGMPDWAGLLWEFLVIFIFLNHPFMSLIDGVALNHSLATVFSLLSLIFFIQLIQREPISFWRAFACSACMGLAAFIRFNYASLIVVLFILFWIYKLVRHPPHIYKTLLWFSIGLLLAALPALGLMITAPTGFYFTNIVYTRLNTIYYQELLFRSNMDLPAKVSGFLSHLLSTPLDLVLYAFLIFVGIASFIGYIRNKSPLDLCKLALASFAFTLFLTAFAPTPTQEQYYFAPLAFMLVILAVVGSEIYQKTKPGFYFTILLVVLTLIPSINFTNPLIELGYLSNPAKWTPVQVHDFAEEIKGYVPRGRILTLIPMIPLEVGYDIYPFTATGPFIWRTSLLLTPRRRTLYGVISPQELPGLLKKDPPDAILTGFEDPNAGFIRNDPGTLETPFINYAKANGYKLVSLPAPYIYRPLSLWIRQP